MGYVDDQEGIMQRYINEEGGWNEHLNNSKYFIKQCISDSQPKNVTVLGSGWLLDVPIEFLAENCSQVFLFDIRHPEQVKHKHRDKNNVHFINIDITGGAILEVYNCMNSGTASNEAIESIIVPGFSSSEPLDYIISVNILNQLDILLIEYLRRFSEIQATQLGHLRKKVQEAHISGLLPGKACLISDYEEMLFDKENNLKKSNNLLFTEFPKGIKESEWIWRFDTQMTYYPEFKTHFKVKAIQI